jgi:Zn-dependent protease/predicted transcriptional regulator
MFGKRMKLFTLLGFDVHVDASWVILAVLIVWTLAQGFFPVQHPGLSAAAYWWMAAAGAVGLFLSIIIHEFAHSLVARKYGIPMKGITLFLFGGVAEMDSEPPSPKSEFRMAIAGPMASVALAGLFYAASLILRPAGEATAAVLSYLALINGLLAAFNLIPAFPLDGGRVLRAFLWERKNDIREATKTASRVGSAFGLILIVLGVIEVVLGNFIGGMWWFLIGMFLRGASQTSYRQLQIRQALEGEPVSRFMKTHPVTVPPLISLSDMVDDYMYRHYHELFPVVDGSRLIGCVGLKDLKKVPREEWHRRTVEDLMQPCSERNTIHSEADTVKALAQMSKTGTSRLMVVDDGRLQGVVTLKDLLGFLSVKLDLEGGEVRERELEHVAENTS